MGKRPKATIRLSTHTLLHQMARFWVVAILPDAPISEVRQAGVDAREITHRSPTLPLPLDIMCHTNSALVQAFAQSYYEATDVPPLCSGISLAYSQRVPNVTGLVEFAARSVGVETAPIRVYVGNGKLVSRRHPGHSRSYISREADALAGFCYAVELLIPPARHFPVDLEGHPTLRHQIKRLGRYFTHAEWVIHVAAHEFRHVAGYMADQYQIGEAVCDEAGLQAVLAYRQHGAQP